MSPSEGSSAPSARTILIVDDDADILDALQDLLLDAGYAVVCAMDGTDGLRRLRGSTPAPDVVLLDLVMPGMNGWEFIREMCGSQRTACVPVVVCTAGEPRWGYPVSRDRVVHKPVKVEWLFRVLRELTGSCPVR